MHRDEKLAWGRDVRGEKGEMKVRGAIAMRLGGFDHQREGRRVELRYKGSKNEAVARSALKRRNQASLIFIKYIQYVPH